MAGVKGKSGRKSKYEEWNIAEIVNGSLRYIKWYLEDPNADPAKKAEIASRFALKMIPDRIAHSHAVAVLSNDLLVKMMPLLNEHKPKEILSDSVAVEIIPEDAKTEEDSK